MSLRLIVVSNMVHFIHNYARFFWGKFLAEGL
jgi:hypothetical protein